VIEFKKGNLLEADAEALVNTVNCVGVMGKGIALQFKQTYPSNFHVYEEACKAKKVQPGQMLIVSTNGLLNPKYIINFPTKRHWKGKSKLEDVQNGLVALIKELKDLRIQSVAIPALGCGNGGLDWLEVEPLIQQAFAQIPNVSVLLFAPQGEKRISTKIVKIEKKPELNRPRAMLIALIQRYSKSGNTLTSVELQNLTYILQESGEPLHLNYENQEAGPYANSLNKVLEQLEGHYIMGYENNNPHAIISLLPGTTELAQQLLLDKPDALSRLNQISQLITGFESSSGLKLITKIHYTAWNNVTIMVDSLRTIRDIVDWAKSNNLTFEPKEIQEAWQRLHDNKWLKVGDKEIMYA